ncbi:MAG: glycosyltransferase, partial [Bacteroidota bacterium]|nr:glycosyltransferase [Bacteroidota bacterium]
FSKRPMHFFGLWGTAFFFLGLVISLYLIISKIVDPQFALTNRPGFFMALTALILGMQLFLAGFIAELIARNAPGRNSYLIEKKLGL